MQESMSALPVDQVARRTRIKLCGFTRREDVDEAVRLGADALGFVFYPKSKRYVDPAKVHRLVSDIPAFVTTVALFVDPQPDFVFEVLDAMRPGLLQFHGDESEQTCTSYRWPYVKAFRVGAPGMESEQVLAAHCSRYAGAAGWLFDSYTPAYGGSGHGFERSLLNGVRSDIASRPLILSGGLQVDNVGSLVAAIRPWAVDVSSGIESAPGQKCPDKMRHFIAAVRQADMQP